MASVGSVSGSSSAFYNNKISGLASGMDTESMIENMTAATRAKIAKQKQNKFYNGKWTQCVLLAIC